MRLNNRAIPAQTLLEFKPLEHNRPLLVIPLTQGQVAIVDPEDYVELAKFKWHARWDKNSGTFYAQRMSSYINGKRHIIHMHRIILEAPDGTQVDHRDLNGLNNQKYNLRLATSSQNGSNRKRSSNNKSGFKGVSFYRRYQKWRAQIGAANKHLWLGDFDTKEAASAAYIEAAKQLHGEFANW